MPLSLLQSIQNSREWLPVTVTPFKECMKKEEEEEGEDQSQP